MVLFYLLIPFKTYLQRTVPSLLGTLKIYIQLHSFNPLSTKTIYEDIIELAHLNCAMLKINFLPHVGKVHQY